MPKDFRATMLERAIGRTIGEWRSECGLSLAEASKRVGFSIAKLSIMENALQPSASIDIMALGYVYRVPTPEWQSLAEMAQWATLQRLPKPEGQGQLFDPADDFARIHTEAIRLRAYRSDLIPTVLQTHGYALAVMKADDPLRAMVNAERQRAVNAAWQTRLYDKEPLTIEAVIHESAIRQVIGGPRTLSAQLLYLVELSTLPHVAIQVIAHDADSCPAVGFPFAVLSFPHRQHDDVVYVDTFLKSEYIEDQHNRERCVQRFTALQHAALSPANSLELIAEAASDLRPAA